MVVLAACLATVAIAPPSSAITALQRARRAEHDLHVQIRRLREQLHHLVARSRRVVPLDEVVLAKAGQRLDTDRSRALRRWGERATERLQGGFDRRARRVERAVERLAVRRRALATWLWTYGVFEVCPVPRHTVISDDFGGMVRLPHVPVHRHMGNDVLAPTWSPILAPFDGYASTSWSGLGGREVRVLGPRGYAYNAHLAGVGRLGWVRAGTVVGYVGDTGDATAPHDHFEWHPGGRGAVDPHTYLMVACSPT
jgi:murein DD-endopeptidase MepM/ murein hydrolase activator NlpD